MICGNLIGENVTGVEQLNFSDVLSHWEGRFHTITLEDRNLPVIAQKRVLKPKNDACRAELEEAFEKTAQVRQEIMEVLLTREADRAMFKMVYPFSPALIQALVAVSSALQRERTALKIMLQLLVNRRDTLRLGDVIPLGDLWDVVAHGDEAFTDVMRVNFENAKKLYQNKLLPMLEQQHEIDLEVDRERAKTETEDRRETPAVRERRPAHQEPAAVRPGSRRRDAQEHDLHAAGRTQPRDDPLPHSGPGTSGRRPEAPHLGGHGRRDSGGRGADQSDGLDSSFRAWIPRGSSKRPRRSTTSATASSRFEQMLFQSLGIPEQDEMFISHTFLWRGSKRSCDVLFTNVRTLPDESLRSSDDWKLIIDFPFDTEGHSPIEDLDRLDKFREKNERQRTLVWLPSFFSTRTQAELGKLVIIDRLLLGQQPRPVCQASVAARSADRAAVAPESAECPVAAAAAGG